ncbi:MAG: hypothetical protein OSB03_14670, partial [Vicinamibacterales bacterium]|nr:hypothetical protein [Vicinamibacterales bacterium]
MRMVWRLILGFFLVQLVPGDGPAWAQSVADSYTPVTEEMLADAPAEDWLMWRRTYGHWGYSPLDQINTSNVASLRLAWAWTMG